MTVGHTGRGHAGQSTVTVLGRPITFGIACCLAPLHKGPCRKGGYGEKAKKAISKAAPKTAPKSRPKKATKTAVPRPGHRQAEISRIMDRPTHHGVVTAAIPRMMAQVGQRPGWRYDPADMSVTYDGSHGRAGVELVSGGFRAVGPENPNLRLPKLDRVFRDFHSAFEAARIHGGNPRPPSNG